MQLREGVTVIGIVSYLLILSTDLAGIIPLDMIDLFIVLAILIFVPIVDLWFFYNQIDVSRKIPLYLASAIILSFIAIIVAFAYDRGLVSGILILPLLSANTIFVVWCLKIMMSSYNSMMRFLKNNLLLCSVFLFHILGPGVLLISRVGLRPLGFTHLLIKLTVIHFHYSGILLPTVVLMLEDVRSQIDQSWDQKHDWTLPKNGLSVATIIVALGITFSIWIPLIGIIAVSYFVLIVYRLLYLIYRDYIIHLQFQEKFWLSLILITFSLSMFLAFYYAFGQAFAISTIGIPNMLITHGIFNGIIFIPFFMFYWFWKQKMSN